MTDTIICSAIKGHEIGEYWYGKRHSDCIWLMTQFGRKFSDLDEQGFWVIKPNSLGRFVDRKEAYRIAVEAGIIPPDPGDMVTKSVMPDLYSEDLW